MTYKVISLLQQMFFVLSFFALSLGAMQNYDPDSFMQLYPSIDRSHALYQSPLMQRAQKILNEALLRRDVKTVEYLLSRCPELSIFYCTDTLFYRYYELAYLTYNQRIIAAFETCVNGKPIMPDTQKKSIPQHILFLPELLQRITDSL